MRKRVNPRDVSSPRLVFAKVSDSVNSRERKNSKKNSGIAPVLKGSTK